MMERIKQLIDEGKIAEALCLLNELIADDSTSDEAFYLRGNVYRKLGDWREALNNYLVAKELNPQSPAHKAYQMVMDILDFHTKDTLNP
jgi:tetratricopeptide (TPR) repeat protein